MKWKTMFGRKINNQTKNTYIFEKKEKKIESSILTTTTTVKVGIWHNQCRADGYGAKGQLSVILDNNNNNKY